MTETIRRALPVLALILALAVAAPPARLWAQQEPEPAGTESSGEAPASTQETQSEQDEPPPATGEDPPSPFDYEASEEISEDLSVSFPVDI